MFQPLPPELERYTIVPAWCVFEQDEARKRKALKELRERLVRNSE